MEIFFVFLLISFFNLIIFLKFEKISKKLIIFDKPDGNLKKHEVPVSLAGGLIILINLYLIIFSFKFFNLEDLMFNDNFIFAFIILSTSFYLIGLVDDLKNLSPNIKLFFLFVVISLTIYFSPEFRLDYIKISFLTKFYTFDYSGLFLILSFVLLANAMNMFDGINLQLILFTFFMFIIFILKGFISTFFLLLLIPLTFLAILNFQNKVFLGDGGSYLISAILGSTFIYQYNNFENYLFGDEVFLILIIPSIDMLRLFFLRIIYKKNPFKGDLNHLHHLVNNFTQNTSLTVLITITLCIFPSIVLLMSVPSYIILILSLIFYFSFVTYLRIKI